MIVAPPPPRLPLHFAVAPGWRTGAGRAPLYASAWTANVVYRDAATADPPNRTLARLRGGAIVVFASLGRDAEAPRLPVTLAHARRYACCEGATPGWPFLLEPRTRGGLVVRVYFGSRPTGALLARAQRALDRLRNR